MKQIAIVGALWSGSFQPSLTGNQIVDKALLQRYSQRLTDYLTQSGMEVTVDVAHQIDQQKLADNETLFLIDQQIVDKFNDHLTSFIPVSHIDLLHGDPTRIVDVVLKTIKHKK